MYVDEETLNNDTALNSILIHEFAHTLGFKGHDNDNRGCNMLTGIACAPMETYNEYDTYAINALYNSGLPLRSTHTEAQEFLQNLY